METYIVSIFIAAYIVLYYISRIVGIRVSELFVKYSLETMPKKSMAIDEQLESNKINETEKNRKRELLNIEIKKISSFYDIHVIIKVCIFLEIVLLVCLMIFDVVEMYIFIIGAVMWICTLLVIFISFFKLKRLISNMDGLFK